MDVIAEVPLSVREVTVADAERSGEVGRFHGSASGDRQPGFGIVVCHGIDLRSGELPSPRTTTLKVAKGGWPLPDCEQSWISLAAPPAPSLTEGRKEH
ncbi:hypothetical protein GCM10027598_27720 [Amycolatopsis oliviviridis]|uniref:Uncharacterized protein n=1 Tax=Amycolatopsis oliviviridis TaxID=1471590 RepID=A0ABQ3LMX0_9PSEU|nr:hypothetical protein GCM10017790_35370 [Amycolatopsis oliviviridis]